MDFFFTSTPVPLRGSLDHLCYAMLPRACMLYQFCTFIVHHSSSMIPPHNEMKERREERKSNRFLFFVFFSVEEEQHYIPPHCIEAIERSFFYSFIRACVNEWMDEGVDLVAV